MTLSIDVLPAPLGPMMARISPLRISKETSLTAFTPPNASETFSTESSTSPTATSGPPVALMGGFLRAPELPSPRERSEWWGGVGGGGRNRMRARRAPHPGPQSRAIAVRPSPPLRGGRERKAGARRRKSCRRLQRGRRGDRLHVADLHPRADRALAAVLESDLRRDVGLRGAVIERGDQRRVA